VAPPLLEVIRALSVAMCGADFVARIRKQFDEYDRVIREANIKAE
jgi:hypothetical protein